MNCYLKKTLKTYLLFMGILIFASTLLSPDFQGETLLEYLKNGCALIVYRITIFSVFALLFATLFTLQSFERQNVSIAISMSGKHSFAILFPLFLFAICLSTICVASNAFLLGPAIKKLGRDALITPHKKLKVYELDNGTLFFSENFANFTFITKEKEIFFSNRAFKRESGFLLENMEHFIQKEHSYQKVEAKNNFFLKIDPSSIKPFSSLLLSSTLPKLLYAYLDGESTTHINTNALSMTIFYRTIFPFLHLFSVALAAIFAFANYFRKKYYLSLSLCIFLSLFAFYLLECSAILASGNKTSPLFFLLFTLLLLVVPPYITYAKKV